MSKTPVKGGPKAPSERMRLRRLHSLAAYDRPTVEQILDATPLCHVGYVIDGVPFVTPTLQWREGDRVYWHGSRASRMLRSVVSHEVCLSVSLVDGLVLARSAYNYTVNYRSVTIVGRPTIVDDPAKKAAHLQAFVDRLIPGQWERLRPMKSQELKATTLVSMSIDEASAKLRVGQPEDEPDDYGFPVWAGVIPIRRQTLAPEADPRNIEGVEMPPEVLRFEIG